MANITVPPLLAERDKTTGLLKNIQYTFNEDGTVNWRKMVEPQFLAVNNENFKRKNLPVPETIDGLGDNDLIILLSGLKKLAKLRGYSKHDPIIKVACPDYVAAECRITWLPHRDDGMEVQTTGGNAMATLQNTDGFTKCYLAEMAQNRAFARCIRDFLGINIVSKEEIADVSEETSQTVVETSPTDTYKIMEAEMTRTGKTFEDIKKKLIEETFRGAAEFNTIKDIPKYKVLALIKRLKSIKSA